MSAQFRFRVRPGYQSNDLLVEFCDDHRADSFPNVGKLLSSALGSTQKKHPEIDEASIGTSMDRFFSYWVFDHGAYEIDDDIWALFISAPVNNSEVIPHIERALLANGQFVKEEVNFEDYA